MREPEIVVRLAVGIIFHSRAVVFPDDRPAAAEKSADPAILIDSDRPATKCIIHIALQSLPRYSEKFLRPERDKCLFSVAF